ncbi:response regulator transcription factor [Nitrobacter sp. NHB1]|uniref:response regulator transcription factor n=1 Tax=Nitrobacter sp. NHB1 TaxID=3119830 RepID=UPI002FFE27E8
MPRAADFDHDGCNAQRFNGTDDSFSDATKTARNAIIIIDERALVRDCLVYCLQAKYVSHAVFAFATLSEWMKVENDFPVPSVILLCVQTRQKNALSDSDDVESLARVAVSAPLIIVSDVEDGSRIMRAIESGARGYIPTSMTLGIAVEAVRLVEAGGTFVPISVMSSFQNRGNGESQLFTARQIMVVEALCRGRANKQIAYELGMCESTVKVHIRHIMRKLKARNRTEVAMMVSSLFDKLVDQKFVSNT